MGHVRIAKLAAGLALGFTVASCIVAAQPQPVTPVATGEQPGEAESGPLVAQSLPDGAYSCSIDKYDPYPCRVTTDPDGRKRLEKLAGSQRFSGIATPTQDGFVFQGTLFCPWGDCTEAISGTFQAYDDGLFRGTLSGQRPMTVTVQYTEYGGYGYGGANYGGGYYGGALYGYRY